MNSRILKFGDILCEEQRYVEVLDDEEYACAGVRLHGNGVFVREFKTGRDILKKFVQHTVTAGDIVFSTLFARSGAFAVAESDVEGAILSEKFPTYRLVDDRISLDYLKWFFRSGQLAEISARQVTGVAVFSLSHLSKKKFLNLPVPVPSADRQAYVVNTCEEVFTKVSMMKKATHINGVMLQHIVPVTTDRLLKDMPCVPLASLGNYETRGATIRPDETYSQITAAMRHRGLRLRRRCLGAEIRSPGQCYVREGDILFSRIDLRQGAIGVVSKDLEGAVVTRDFPVFRLHDTNAEALEFLSYIFRAPCFMKQAQDASRGTTGRKKLKRDRFLEFQVPWPSLPDRKRVLATLRDLESSTTRMVRERRVQEIAIQALPKSVSGTLYGDDAGLFEN